MHKYAKCGCEAPCKYEPVVMPVKETVCNRYYTVEQPVICPVNRRIVNHYVPRPVYYHTYTQCEETVCEQSPYGGNMTTEYEEKPHPYNR